MEAEEADIKGPACPGCVERDRRIAALERRNAELEKRLGELERLVDQLRRGGKRQAAPGAMPSCSVGMAWRIDYEWGRGCRKGCGGAKLWGLRLTMAPILTMMTCADHP